MTPRPVFEKLVVAFSKACKPGLCPFHLTRVLKLFENVNAVSNELCVILKVSILVEGF